MSLKLSKLYGISSIEHIMHILRKASIKLVVYTLFLTSINFSVSADCRLCPEITSVKILLKNGVIRKGHIAVDPQEELTVKPERGMEVMRKLEKLRLFLSLDPLTDFDAKMPHLLYDKVYMDIPYKDIAKIELLGKIDK